MKDQFKRPCGENQNHPNSMGETSAHKSADHMAASMKGVDAGILTTGYTSAGSVGTGTVRTKGNNNNG